MKRLLLVAVLLITVMNLSSCKKKDKGDKTKITVTVLLWGDPASGAQLHLFKETDYTRYIKTKTTNSSGKAVFEVKPGDYSFECDYTDEYGDVYGAGTSIFSVSKNENKKITINLEDY